MIPIATTACLLNTSRKGDSIIPLGSPFQYFATLSKKRFFLMSNLNLHGCDLGQFPCIISLKQKINSSHCSFLSGSCTKHWGVPSYFSRLNNSSFFKKTLSTTVGSTKQKEKIIYVAQFQREQRTQECSRPGRDYLSSRHCVEVPPPWYYITYFMSSIS